MVNALLLLAGLGLGWFLAAAVLRPRIDTLRVMVADLSEALHAREAAHSAKLDFCRRAWRNLLEDALHQRQILEAAAPERMTLVEFAAQFPGISLGDISAIALAVEECDRALVSVKAYSYADDEERWHHVEVLPDPADEGVVFDEYPAAFLQGSQWPAEAAGESIAMFEREFEIPKHVKPARSLADLGSPADITGRVRLADLGSLEDPASRRWPPGAR